MKKNNMNVIIICSLGKDKYGKENCVITKLNESKKNQIYNAKKVNAFIHLIIENDIEKELNYFISKPILEELADKDINKTINILNKISIPCILYNYIEIKEDDTTYNSRITFDLIRTKNKKNDYLYKKVIKAIKNMSK